MAKVNTERALGIQFSHRKPEITNAKKGSKRKQILSTPGTRKLQVHADNDK
jgi:hypothetical protein